MTEERARAHVQQRPSDAEERRYGGITPSDGFIPSWTLGMLHSSVCDLPPFPRTEQPCETAAWLVDRQPLCGYFFTNSDPPEPDPSPPVVSGLHKQTFGPAEQKKTRGP